MLGSVLQMIYNLIDTFVVGRFVSSDALAAVGVTSSINSFLVGFAIGITAGFSIPVSQAVGAEDYKKIHKLIGNATVITFIFGVCITLIAILCSGSLLRLIDTPENIFKAANQYAVINYIGILFIMFYNMLASMLRAMGDSKTPLYFLIISVIINVVFDIVFVVVFKMGVKGVAISTLVSRGVSVFLCLWYVKKYYPSLALKKEDFKMEKETDKLLLKMGIPMALQSSIIALGGMILQKAVNSFGSDAVAAISIANKIEQIVNIPLSNIGTALATFAAQNMGAKKYNRILESEKKALILDLGLSVFASINLFFFGKHICSIFVNDENAAVILSYADRYCKVLAVFYFALSILFIYRNMLQGLGFPYASIFAGASELIGRAIVAFCFVGLFGFDGICLAGPLAWLLADIPLLFVYKKKRKCFIKMIELESVTA